MLALTAIMAVLRTQTVSADEFVMKDGSKQPATILRDLGDAYEVETGTGARTMIKKTHIERILPVSKDASPLAGAAFTRLSGKTRILPIAPILERAKPVENLFGPSGAEMRVKGGVLVLDLRADEPCRVQFPVKLGEEYDLSMTVERKDGVGDFFVGLIADGKCVLVRIDADQGSRTGVEGMAMEPCSQVLRRDEAVALSFHVRRDSLGVFAEQGGEKRWPLLSWRGSWADVPAAPGRYLLPGVRTFAFIGSQKIYGTPANLWHVSNPVVRLKD